VAHDERRDAGRTVRFHARSGVAGVGDRSGNGLVGMGSPLYLIDSVNLGRQHRGSLLLVQLCKLVPMSGFRFNTLVLRL